MNMRGMFASLFREKKPVQDSVDPIYDSLVRLFESDRFPEKVEMWVDRPVKLMWDKGLMVEARQGRWPLVIVTARGCQFKYEYDNMLVESVFKFARRAEAARDRTGAVEAINKILQ